MRIQNQEDAAVRRDVCYPPATQHIEMFQMLTRSGLFDSSAKHQGYVFIFSFDIYLRSFPVLGQDPRVVA
jgi:hypothetical protein